MSNVVNPEYDSDDCCEPRIVKHVYMNPRSLLLSTLDNDSSCYQSTDKTTDSSSDSNSTSCALLTESSDEESGQTGNRYDRTELSHEEQGDKIMKAGNVSHWTSYPYLSQFVSVKLFLSVILWFVAYSIMGLAGSVAFYHFPRLPDSLNAPLALPDFGYDLIPYWCPMIDNKINVQSSILLLFYILIIIGAVFHTKGRLVMQQLLHLNIAIFLTRTTTVFVTGLPQPNPRCTAIQSWDSSLWDSIQFVWRSFPPHACGDLLYSGHVACILVCMVIFHKYRYFGKSLGLMLLAWLATFFGIYAVISCRSHYTVDVILAFYFVFFIQEAYFSRSEGRSAYDNKGYSITAFIKWLESESITLY